MSICWFGKICIKPTPRNDAAPIEKKYKLINKLAAERGADRYAYS